MKSTFIILSIYAFLNTCHASDACKDSNTSYEYLMCMQSEKARLDEHLAIYIKNIIHLNKDDKKFIEALDESNKLWSAFLKHECGAIQELCNPGSGCGGMALSCEVGYTEKRLHFLWNEYLSNYRFNEPLPEPPKL